MSLFDGRCVFLPYCLKMQECGRYAVLNRAYKPLGFFTRDYIEYSDYPVLLTVRITSKTAAKISHCNDTNVSEIFLYDDGCIPTRSFSDWECYAARLQTLLSIPIHGGAQNVESVSGRAIRFKNIRDAKKTL